LSLLFGESGLLSFGVLALWHNGQSPLVLASEGSVLEGDGFEISVGDVEGEGVSFSIAFYKGAGTGANTTNLEVGVVVEVNEVGVSLGELSKGGCSFILLLESLFPLLTVMIEGEVMADSPGVGRGGVVVVVDEATYDGQIISSLDNRDEVVDEGFWKKNWGVLFSKWPSFVVVEIARGFSFGMGTEWSRQRKPLESEFGEMGPALILIPFG
jgi:hypothetical protein